MAFERHVGGSLDYAPCRYGSSRLQFRGPSPDLDGDYVAFLGSTETYGKFVRTPFPSLTGRALGIGALNLGCVNAGVDCFLDDPAVCDLANRARASVVQIMGAQKLSNRFFSVHPRRNDRFLTASQMLCRLYPEAEFTDVHFTRHLLEILRKLDAGRFGAVVAELRRTWVARMTELLGRLRVPVVLLWISDRSPDEQTRELSGSEPLFVTRAMLEAVRPDEVPLLEVLRPLSRPGALPRGMVCSAFEAPAAVELPGPACHAEIALALREAVASFVARH